MSYRFEKLPDVLSRTQLSKSTVYEWIKRGDFPAPIALGPRSVGWLTSEIDSWIEQRVAARTSPFGEE